MRAWSTSAGRPRRRRISLGTLSVAALVTVRSWSSRAGVTATYRRVHGRIARSSHGLGADLSGSSRWRAGGHPGCGRVTRAVERPDQRAALTWTRVRTVGRCGACRRSRVARPGPSHPAGTPATGGVQHHMILVGRCGAADSVLPERRAHERIRTTLGGPRPWEGHRDPGPGRGPRLGPGLLRAARADRHVAVTRAAVRVAVPGPVSCPLRRTSGNERLCCCAGASTAGNPERY
jgi:hypothetical protein